MVQAITNGYRKVRDISRGWFLVVMIATVAGATWATLAKLEAMVEKRIDVHAHHTEAHPSISKRLDKIDGKLDRQWRLLRKLPNGDDR